VAGVGLAGAAVAGVLGWGLARGYGWRVGLIVPLVALLSLIAVLWRARGLGLADSFDLAAKALVVAGPALAGALLGVVLAAQRRR